MQAEYDAYTKAYEMDCVPKKITFQNPMWKPKQRAHLNNFSKNFSLVKGDRIKLNMLPYFSRKHIPIIDTLSNHINLESIVVHLEF